MKILLDMNIPLKYNALFIKKGIVSTTHNIKPSVVQIRASVIKAEKAADVIKKLYIKIKTIWIEAPFYQ